MSKKMTEKEAWEYIQKSFKLKNLKNEMCDKVYSFYERQQSYGMCHTIGNLFYRGLISAKLHDLLKKKINEYCQRSYLYPTTLYGARKRREFCRYRIKEL